MSNVRQLMRALQATDTTFFIDPIKGQDSNQGMAANNAWKTGQGAWNNLAQRYDGGGHKATINLLPGKYSGAGTLGYFMQMIGLVGWTSVAIQSSTGNSSDVTIDCAKGSQGAFSSFDAGSMCSVTAFNLTLTSSDLSNVNFADIEAPTIFQFQNCVLGAVGSGGIHAYASGPGAAVYTNSCTITGGGGANLAASAGGQATSYSDTISGVPAFSLGFRVGNNGALLISGNVSGTATGPRYKLTGGTKLNLWQGDYNSQPGSSIGIIDATSSLNYLGADGALHPYVGT